MTKNQFLKKLGLKDCPIRYYKPYLDIIARYKGRLSYCRLWLLIHIAVRFGRRGPDDILSYVTAVMDSEVPRIRTKVNHIGLRATYTNIDELHTSTEVSK